jgi:hypothetical protein
MALESTKPLIFLGVKNGRRVRMATSSGSLDVSQLYGPARPVTGIALPLAWPLLTRTQHEVIHSALKERYKHNLTSIATEWTPEQSKSDSPRGTREIPFSIVSRPALGPVQSQKVSKAIFITGREGL